LGEVLAKAESEKGGVVACSALKETYRKILQAPLKSELLIVWLDGSREVLLERLNSRKNHFFPPHLLDSQLATLEPPQGAIRIDIDQPIEDMLQQAIKALQSS